ncbi:MAG: SprT-like domain-containing protein [Clostridia bacterium]|nr:SprT-like domain-containing protein [Clostridia bacterium]
MEEKLQHLFNECKNELYDIGIDIENKNIGNISISIGKRNCKRYGCCKQEQPIESTKYIERIGRKKYIKYKMYASHKIEISKWVMDLKPNIIKNTIMHEIIHCFPNCSNHGEDFKKYAHYISYKLGYDISRLGDKNSDLMASNIVPASEKYNYKIQCTKCGYSFYRKRLNCNFSRNYRCGKCGGHFITAKGEFRA